MVLRLVRRRLLRALTRTKSAGAEARRAPAFRRSSNTRTMDSEWCAPWMTEMRPRHAGSKQKALGANFCATRGVAKMKFAFMLGWIDAALLIGFAIGCTAGGRRRNGGGTAGAEAAGTSRRAGAKTGQHAAKASKSRQYNHRSSRTAIHFLSRNCHEPRSAEHQAEIRTFRWRERRALAVSPFGRRRGHQPGARFPRRVRPGNGWVRKTVRFVDGYGSVQQFFRNVFDFFD